MKKVRGTVNIYNNLQHYITLHLTY